MIWEVKCGVWRKIDLTYVRAAVLSSWLLKRTASEISISLMYGPTKISSLVL